MCKNLMDNIFSISSIKQLKASKIPSGLQHETQVLQNDVHMTLYSFAMYNSIPTFTQTLRYTCVPHIQYADEIWIPEYNGKVTMAHEFRQR